MLTFSDDADWVKYYAASCIFNKYIIYDIGGQWNWTESISDEKLVRWYQGEYEML